LALKISSNSSSYVTKTSISFYLSPVRVGKAYRATLCLRDKEVDNQSLDWTPDDENNVRLPSDFLQCNRVRELIHQRC
jgi:hypothetical protein